PTCTARSFGRFWHEPPARVTATTRPPRLPRAEHARPRLAGPGLAARFDAAQGGAGRSGVARRRAAAAFTGEGQAVHLPLQGRRAVTVRDLRQQTPSGPVKRPADARVVYQRPADRPAPGAEALLPAAAVRVPALGPIRPGDHDALPAPRLG